MEYAFILHKNNPHWGYSELKKNLTPRFERLIHEDDKLFKDKCQYAFNQITSIIKNENKGDQYQLKKLDPQKIHEILKKLTIMTLK